jgi:hypothetical protein
MGGHSEEQAPQPVAHLAAVVLSLATMALGCDVLGAWTSGRPLTWA